jgi:hypothetical protein
MPIILYTIQLFLSIVLMKRGNIMKKRPKITPAIMKKAREKAEKDKVEMPKLRKLQKEMAKQLKFEVDAICGAKRGRQPL